MSLRVPAVMLGVVGAMRSADAFAFDAARAGSFGRVFAMRAARRSRSNLNCARVTPLGFQNRTDVQSQLTAGAGPTRIVVCDPLAANWPAAATFSASNTISAPFVS